MMFSIKSTSTFATQVELAVTVGTGGIALHSTVMLAGVDEKVAAF